MNRLQRAAVLAELADRLRANGSWCGETHLQKSAYFLQDLLGVPLGVEYILYKHGPYSFDLAEGLTGMRADFLLSKEYRAAGYGPALIPTPTSVEVRARYPKTLGKYARPINFVARVLGSKGVAELEKLATALYVTRDLGPSAEATKRADRLHFLKPHIDPADALKAVHEYDQIAADSRSFVVNDE